MTPEDKARSERLPVRLSAEELAQIDAAARRAYLSRSAWIRSRLLDAAAREAPTPRDE